MLALLSLCAQIGKTPPSLEEPHGLCPLPKAPSQPLVPGHARWTTPGRVARGGPFCGELLTGTTNQGSTQVPGLRWRDIWGGPE